MRYVTRTSALEYEDFNSAKSRLIERAEKFGEISYKVCKLIAYLKSEPFPYSEPVFMSYTKLYILLMML